jgi:anaerobic ribonucleoside-triphosphate reductase activating protein
VQINDLAAIIGEINSIDGVTFSGGEPFAQAAPLAELGALLHRAGLSIATFTGFTWDQLTAKNRPAWRNLLKVTDILIAGPYYLNAGHAGSTGKHVIHLCEGIPLVEHDGNDLPEEIEFTVMQDGGVVVTGFPGPWLVKELQSSGG